MAWATKADVNTVTGLTVEDADVTRAIATLETITGLIDGVDRPGLTDRDKHWLKLMTCYQTAFMHDNPDLFSRADVTSASQDGESASFRNVDSHLFGPLARKAYRRLSWRGLRAIAAWGDPEAAPAGSRDPNSEAFDNALPWAPL